MDDLLKENIDLKYKEFNDKIINTKMKTLGVRTPILKQIAKKVIKEEKYDYLLNKTRYETYEQMLITGLIISKQKDVKYIINKLDKYMRQNDNWAICDLIVANCKIFKKNKDEVYNYVISNIDDKNNWIQRYCFIILLDYFIEEKYLSKIFNIIDNNKNDYYYVMMAKAWLISTCYIKYPKETLKYLKTTKLDYVTYNKAIDKIRDSKRVDEDDKKVLKNMKKNK